MTGTPAGGTETGYFYKNIPGQLYPQRTVLEQMEEQGYSVAYYYDATPWVSRVDNCES